MNLECRKGNRLLYLKVVSSLFLFMVVCDVSSVFAGGAIKGKQQQQQAMQNQVKQQILQQQQQAYMMAQQQAYQQQLMQQRALQQQQAYQRAAIQSQQARQSYQQQVAVAGYQQQSAAGALAQRNSAQNNSNFSEIPADAADVTTIESIWRTMESSSEVWALMIGDQAKLMTIDRQKELYRAQGIQINKPADQYLQMIDGISQQNPNILKQPFKNVLKFVATVEYDFNDGTNSDQQVLKILGQQGYLKNRERLGLP